MLAFVSSALVSFTPSIARAQAAAPVRVGDLRPEDRERARGLMDAGDRKMGQGDARAALEAYRAAFELVSVPTTGIEVGRAEAALGLWVEARDMWVWVTRYPKESGEPRPFTEARREAERLALELSARIPTLTVLVEDPIPDQLAVVLDGRPLNADLLGVPLRLNPGVHRVEARAPGRQVHRMRVDLSEKTERSVKVVLQPAILESEPAPRDTPQPTRPPRGNPLVMWAGFGLAAAGAVVGTATGVWAFERTALAYEQCMGTSCPPAAAADIDQAKAAGVASTIAFVLGAAGLGVGIWQGIELGRGRDTSPSKASAVSFLPGATGARLLLTTRFQ